MTAFTPDNVYEVYTVALDWNNCEDTVPLVKQPRMRGIKRGLLKDSSDGMRIEDGWRSAVLEWDYLTRAEYGSLKIQFGLGGSIRSRRVTLTLPYAAERSQVEYYNAIVDDPDEPEEARFEKGVWMDVSVRVRRIHEASCD